MSVGWVRARIVLAHFTRPLLRTVTLYHYNVIMTSHRQAQPQYFLPRTVSFVRRFFSALQICQQRGFVYCPDRSKFAGSNLPLSNKKAQILSMIAGQFCSLLNSQPFFATLGRFDAHTWNYTRRIMPYSIVNINSLVD